MKGERGIRDSTSELEARVAIRGKVAEINQFCRRQPRCSQRRYSQDGASVHLEQGLLDNHKKAGKAGALVSIGLFYL